jgi:hypothetical protein
VSQLSAHDASGVVRVLSLLETMASSFGPPSVAANIVHGLLHALEAAATFWESDAAICASLCNVYAKALYVVGSSMMPMQRPAAVCAVSCVRRHHMPCALDCLGVVARVFGERADGLETLRWVFQVRNRVRRPLFDTVTSC